MPVMPPDPNFIDALALRMLDEESVEAIWGLHTLAAHAHRAGQVHLATGFIEIAEAAEREWLRREEAAE